MDPDTGLDPGGLFWKNYFAGSESGYGSKIIDFGSWSDKIPILLAKTVWKLYNMYLVVTMKYT